jgi:aldehyde dehydrogenase (NAD+)
MKRFAKRELLLAPFGGYKQSGIGREYGVFGLEAFLETKAILGVGVMH